MSLCVLPVGCGRTAEPDVVVPPHKGARSPMMQAAADGLSKLSLVDKDSTYRLADGLTVTEAHFTYMTRPIQLFVAEVDLTAGLEVVTCTPDNENVQELPQVMSEQMLAAEKAGKHVLAGVNGDFAGERSDRPGHFFSMNVFVKEGQILRDKYPEGYEGVFLLTKGGEYKIIHPSEFDGIKDDVLEAMGGYHALVKAGKVHEDLPIDLITMQFGPRTVAGLSQDRKKCWLIVIDGRQAGYSDGLRLEDVSLLCKELGCYDALNLDGGGSSVFVIKDEDGGFTVRNKPSDGQERKVINGLVVVKK